MCLYLFVYFLDFFSFLWFPNAASIIGFALALVMIIPIVLSSNVSSLLCSLDKRASILDLRVECQDLEKLSVINRFAKFHGRGQADGAETSSSSGAIASSHKFFPQRYVTALPMPRNLPDRVQCLSF